MRYCTKAIIFALLSLFLWGCTNQPQETYRAPIADLNRAPPKLSGSHTVSEGDTLYSIAWRYNRNFQELAQVNGLKPPYALRPGQSISLAQKSTHWVSNTPPPAAPVARVPSKPPVSVASKTPISSPNSAMESLPKGAVNWQWPSDGRTIAYFSIQKGQKGIDISGKSGQAVLAAAPGKIVYSGEGLRGYGKLVIIKHNEDYLSAYAHNSRLLVKEGDFVKAQAKIAEMGQTDADSVRLHFEIRKAGQPVDPLKYLPKRG